MTHVPERHPTVKWPHGQTKWGAMSAYTVTIQHDGDRTEAGSTYAVIRVETGPPSPRIVEMAVYSSSPEGLTAKSLPAIDLNLVVDALQSGVYRSSPASVQETERPKAVAAPSKPVRQKSHRRPTLEPGHDDQSADAATAADEKPADVRADRAYRRMPDADELQAAYERIGTVTGIAKHYGVPRHTAQGWMSRLRKLRSTDQQSSARVRPVKSRR